MTRLIRISGLILLSAALVAPAIAQSGAATYKAKCAMCHGADGQAASPMAKNMHILPFKAPAMVKASNAQLIAATADGKGRMPAYKGKLSDAQIKEVVAFIRTLQK